MSIRPRRQPGRPTEEEARWRLDCADGVLAATRAHSGDQAQRRLVEQVARGVISADQAVARALKVEGLVARDSGRRLREWEDYFIPGTQTLVNRLTDAQNPLGISDPERFRALEVQISQIRIVDVVSDFPAGDFGYEHMKSIHRRLFSDIYDWAGEERLGPATPVVRYAPDAVNFAAGDPAAPFMKYSYFSGPEIADAASVQYALLASLPLRSDLSRAEAIDLFSEYGGELQTIHAFRDGNVRASCVYGIFFAEALGYPVDPSVFLMGQELRDRLMHARYHNQATGSHGPYFDTLNLAMAPERDVDWNVDHFVRG